MNGGIDFAPLQDGGRLAFCVTKSTAHRTPILLHRPRGGSLALWGELVTRLQDVFQVVSFDPRGVGLSSDVPWLYTTRAMARDGLALLDHLGIERAHVFGLSLGGMVASWLAIDAPTRVRSLALASTIPEPDANSWHGVLRALAMLRCLARPGTAAELALVHRILSAQFRAAEPARVVAIERLIRGLPAKRRNLVNLSLAAAFHCADLRRTAPQLATLLLFGELDTLVGERSRAELLRELPNAQFEIVAHCAPAAGNVREPSHEPSSCSGRCGGEGRWPVF